MASPEDTRRPQVTDEIQVLAEPVDFASLVLEAAPDGIVVADRHGVITQVNRRIEELFGYERGALVGASVEALLPETERQVHTAHRLRYVARPRLRPMGGDLDLWARRADGALFPVEVSLSPLRSGDEQLVIATVRDVSARRAAEQHTRNMSHLLGAIGDAVHLADPDTLVFTYANAAACALTGYDEADLLDMTPLHLLPGVDEPAWRDLVATLDEGAPAPPPVTTVLRRRDGTETTVEYRTELPPVLRGQPRKLVVVLRDVTARIDLETETSAANALLALVDERERIASDLHDTVIQDLFAAGLVLQSSATFADPALRTKIMDVVDQHDAIIRKIRSTIFHLTERRVAGGLQPQLSAVVDEAARVLGFRPSMRVHGPVDAVASAAVVEHLVPSLREAMSNIARHARAARVDVDVAYEDGTLTLRVVDDGVGLPDVPDAAGNGLRNLARRAEHLSATIAFERTEPHGTTITWTVPI